MFGDLMKTPFPLLLRVFVFFGVCGHGTHIHATRIVVLAVLQG